MNSRRAATLGAAREPSPQRGRIARAKQPEQMSPSGQRRIQTSMASSVAPGLFVPIPDPAVTACHVAAAIARRGGRSVFLENA